MNTISAVVITKNEQRNIRACLESLAWTDEIIIVDSASTDNTVSIARSFTSKIIISENIAYGLKRNIGIDNSTSDFVIWLDADERVTAALAKEIKQELEAPSHIADNINRKSFFINKFINYCGWYPDFTLRLFKRSTGLRFDNTGVHEKLSYKGMTGKFRNILLHYTDRDYEQYTSKLNNYTSLSAIELGKRGKKSNVLDLIFRPVFTFFKMYFFKLGFLDGYTGLVLCILSSFHVFFKHAKSSAGSPSN